LVYGFPVGARAALSISEQLTKDNVLELTRLYCDDGYGSNIESYAIGQSFKWFRENDKAIKVLISYADNGTRTFGRYIPSNKLDLSGYEYRNCIDAKLWNITYKRPI